MTILNKKYIMTLDIGGTTFTSGLFDSFYNKISISNESLVNDYNNTSELIFGLCEQIETLYKRFDIDKNDILGLGISAPGPLDSTTGNILDTPNLILLQNTNLIDSMSKELDLEIKIENDANLFALGEWHRDNSDRDVMVGITLGTGLGVGIIINGKLFTGAHGMSAEYGISPYQDGLWEDYISIAAIENKSKSIFKEIMSPKEVFELAEEGNEDALRIWINFGSNLGIMMSHLINLLDPSVIVFGGGISKAYPFFNKPMLDQLSEYSPSFTHNAIAVSVSSDQLYSTHLGAAMLFDKSI